MIVGFGVFLLALVKKSVDLRRGGLAVLFVIALLSLPTYMTGYSAQKSLKGMSGASQRVIALHQRSALTAPMLTESTGGGDWCGLRDVRRGRSAPPGNPAP